MTLLSIILVGVIFGAVGIYAEKKGWIGAGWLRGGLLQGKRGDAPEYDLAGKEVCGLYFQGGSAAALRLSRPPLLLRLALRLTASISKERFCSCSAPQYWI